VWGSSIIAISAPRPANAPPTPVAKYSPPWFVFHRPAAFESCLRSTSGKISRYSSLPTKLRTLRPKPSANSEVFDTCIIFFLGYLPSSQAGNRYEDSSDFVCRGAKLIITRFLSPAATDSNNLAIRLWWLPFTKSGQIYSTNAIKSFCARSRNSLRLSSSTNTIIRRFSSGVALARAALSSSLFIFLRILHLMPQLKRVIPRD